MTGTSGFLYELEIPSSYFSNYALPENLPPSFDVYNVTRSYALNVNAAFSSDRFESSNGEFRNWKITHDAEIQCPDIRVLGGRTPREKTSKPQDLLKYEDWSDGDPYNPNSDLEEKR